MTDRPPLKKHQVGDIDFIRRNRRVVLANEPGLGKSRSALEAVDGRRTLVIAPNMILESGTWEDEISRWADHVDLYQQVSYSQLNRRNKTAKGGTAPVQALADVVKGNKYEALIVDEAHYIKGRDSMWTWAVLELAKQVNMTVLLTGTPIPNWAHEVFNLLRAINPDEMAPGRKYGSFWRWAKEWFDCTPTRFSAGKPVAGELLGCTPACLNLPTHDPCVHYHRFVKANFGDSWRRVPRDESDLPPFTEQRILVPLSTSETAAYRKLKKDFAATIDGEEVLVWHKGALHVTLDKLTISPWLLTKQGSPKGGKLERLRFDLQNRSRPTLVLAHYRDAVEACAEVARSVGATAGYVHGGTGKVGAESVRRFKEGKLDVLVGSLEVVSEGLTLTAADMAIFVEKSFKPSRNLQAARRIHRIGQTRPVTILDYVATGTGVNLDIRKRELLATKTDRQMRYLSAAQFLGML